MKNKIILIGLGAVGSVLAGAISQNPENELTVIVKKNHLLELKKGKKKLRGVIEQDLSLNLRAEFDQPLENTLIIPVVKIYDLKKIIETLADKFRPTSRLLLLTNGLNIREKIVKWSQNRIGLNNIQRGIVSFGATLNSISQTTFYSGSLILDDRMLQSGIFSYNLGGSLTVKTTPDMRKALWKKLIINCIYNPISLVLKIRNSTISLPDLNPLKSQILTECLKIARMDGMTVDFDLDRINSRICSENYTSMLQDYLYNRPTEIDYLNGEIVRLAGRYKTGAPVNQFLVSIVKMFEFIRNNDFSV